MEAVLLLTKLNVERHIEVDVSMDELDVTAAESKATYDEIKAYVLEKHGLKVSSLYISQVKRKCGLDVGQNYNLSKKEDAKVPQCPPEKEAAIMEALKHFQMLWNRFYEQITKRTIAYNAIVRFALKLRDFLKE